MHLSNARIRAFRRKVNGYFDAHGRDLPWRHDVGPYGVFVSEVMLQQTQVDRVIPKYIAFMKRFPAWNALAAAPADRVLLAWQGLGYNRRARFLHQAAKKIVAEHGGRLPRDVDALRALPGIGAATAASIAAFAFDMPTVFIETNIRSVFIHHFFGDQQAIDDDQLLPLVERTLDRRRPARWYSALMDYGVSLKKAHSNPSRRSRHHVRQSPFEGSTRQVRGKILRLLLAEPGLNQTQLAKRIDDPQGRVPQVLARLVEEGMICGRGRGYVAGGP